MDQREGEGAEETIDQDEENADLVLLFASRAGVVEDSGGLLEVRSLLCA